MTFFRTDWHTPEQIPKDSVEVSGERHNELVEGLSRGFVLAVEEGKPALQVPPPAIIPDAVRITRAQGKSQLVAAELFSIAKAWVDSEETPEMVRIGFYDQTHWVITDPFIQLAKEKLGLSDEELQQLFNEAVKI